VRHERVASWALPAAERVRSRLIDLAMRAAQTRERAGDLQGCKRSVCARSTSIQRPSGAIRRFCGRGSRKAM